MGLGTIFSRNKAGADCFLALDIGTEFVKVLVFRHEKDGQRGVVIGYGQARQQLGHMSSGAVSDIGGVIETCDKAIISAQQMAGVKKVRKAVVGIAGELVKGTTTTVHYERSKPEVRIDLPELKNIIQKVQWKAFDRIRKQLAWETGHSEIDVKLINATIVNVKIDGYRIANPMGFQGRDVSISVFNAYAPMVHLGALQKIADELDVELLSIAAEPYAVAQSMGTYNNPDFGAIIIDIGGGTTDVALVRNGGLEGTVMFALGGRAFTKRLAAGFEMSFSEAEKLKLKYSAGALSPEVSSRVDRIFEQDCNVWASGLEIALESFLNYDLLPPRILLCGGGSGLPSIRKVLMSGIWSDKLPMSQQPHISYIQPRDVVNIIDKTKQLRSPQMVTPMSLASLALDITGDENVLSNVLGKAVKMMHN
ncbi:MAG: cell division FtsA domain-containing protein [Patescibacteria group bacterium]|nr:cell division FtsA domain-containing protein [Patescibacteria group bacterium]